MNGADEETGVMLKQALRDLRFYRQELLTVLTAPQHEQLLRELVKLVAAVMEPSPAAPIIPGDLIAPAKQKIPGAVL